MTAGGIVGFVGLGNMGRTLANNVVRAGHETVVFDIAGSEKLAPQGARPMESLAALAALSDIVVLSLPGPPALGQVTQELTRLDATLPRTVIDTSTVGPAAATDAAVTLAAHGVAYLSAPVSGGVRAAAEHRITVMVSGPADVRERVEPVLQGLSNTVVPVGDSPGAAQALKLANNFLAATALLAASEAIAFGVGWGLDLETVLDVINRSSGRNSATLDKFPAEIVTKRYSGGFSNTLMAKDVDLYFNEVTATSSPTALVELVRHSWRQFDDECPGVDTTQMWPYIAKERA